MGATGNLTRPQIQTDFLHMQVRGMADMKNRVFILT